MRSAILLLVLGLVFGLEARNLPAALPLPEQLEPVKLYAVPNPVVESENVPVPSENSEGTTIEEEVILNVYFYSPPNTGQSSGRNVNAEMLRSGQFVIIRNVRGQSALDSYYCPYGISRCAQSRLFQDVRNDLRQDNVLLFFYPTKQLMNKFFSGNEIVRKIVVPEDATVEHLQTLTSYDIPLLLVLTREQLQASNIGTVEISQLQVNNQGVNVIPSKYSVPILLYDRALPARNLKKRDLVYVREEEPVIIPGINLPTQVLPGWNSSIIPAVNIPTQVLPGGISMPTQVLPGGISSPTNILPGGVNLPTEVLPGGINLPTEVLPGGINLPTEVLPGGVNLPTEVLPGGINLPTEVIPGGVNLPTQVLPGGINSPTQIIPGGVNIPTEVGGVALPVLQDPYMLLVARR